MSIVLEAPRDAAIYKRFRLDTGEKCEPVFHSMGIEVVVEKEESARELERHGWRRTNWKGIQK